MFNFINSEESKANCAYYYNETKKELVILGSDKVVFVNILKKFNELSKLVLIITHLDYDNAGNLPSFISYSNTMYNGLKPEIVFPREELKNILLKMNISDKRYVYLETYSFIEKAIHSCDKSYSYILKVNGRKIYYCVDSALLPKKILYKFISRDIKEIYYDMTRFENIPHITIDTLLRLFPKKLRKNVYTMYLENFQTEVLARIHGFSVAK